MAEKVVQQIGEYELISWIQSDLTYYGIRRISETTLLQTYKPTADLKGWDLRAHVTQQLQLVASQVTVPEEIAIPKEWIPEGNPQHILPTMKLPTLCWNPGKRLDHGCNSCHYAFMCRVPIKLFPKAGSV